LLLLNSLAFSRFAGDCVLKYTPPRRVSQKNGVLNHDTSLCKLLITARITFSVGWFGVVAAFLALAITGLTSWDTQVVRTAYSAMELTARFVIVSLALASLLSGLIQSRGTPWGLFLHCWVLVKLLLPKEVDSAFGRPDVLVNNAGVFRFGAFAEITEESFHLRYNILGAILTVQEAIKRFGAGVVLAGKTPFGRLGRVSDIAPLAVFLASDESAWITGEIIRAGGDLVVATWAQCVDLAIAHSDERNQENTERWILWNLKMTILPPTAA
jgi:hypothetical protein